MVVKNTKVIYRIRHILFLVGVHVQLFLWLRYSFFLVDVGVFLYIIKQRWCSLFKGYIDPNNRAPSLTNQNYLKCVGSYCYLCPLLIKLPLKYSIYVIFPPQSKFIKMTNFFSRNIHTAAVYSSPSSTLFEDLTGKNNDKLATKKSRWV